jgi:hypothetical protein
MRFSDYLSKLKVQVHDLCSWSVALDPNRVWIDYVRPGTRFHTTQNRVWLDGVEAKKRLICQGWRPCVTAIAAPEFGNRDLWVSNGHHTLAAYLVLEMKPYVRCFSRASGPNAVGGGRAQIRSVGAGVLSQTGQCGGTAGSRPRWGASSAGLLLHRR